MRLTRDDERARRICSLALEFMNARAPLASSEVARSFYPGLSPDSFRRAFSRDRTALAACGVMVRELPVSGGESSWAVDEEGSYAQGAELEPLEAAALDVACQPLLESSSFPLAGDLRLALAKLTRAFAEASAVSAPPRPEGRAFRELRSCLVGGHAAQATYTDAQGTTTERTIAPYGLFELRGVRYLVAGRLDEQGLPIEGGERTYRVDRFASVRPLPSVPAPVPPDFCVEDWRRLPFQIGPSRALARFEVPAGREEDLERAAGSQGTVGQEGGRTVWSVSVSDMDAAASWAVAMGLRPVSPDELVGSWRRLLEGVADSVS